MRANKKEETNAKKIFQALGTNLNSRVVLVDKLVLDELNRKSGFSDTSRADYDEPVFDACPGNGSNKLVNGLLDVDPHFGACLEEGDAEFFGKVQAFVRGDLPLFPEIGFVSDEDHWKRIDFPDPQEVVDDFLGFLEGGSRRDAVHYDETVASAIVLIAY